MTPPAQENAPALEMIDADIPSLRDASVIVLEGVRWVVAPGDYWVIGGLNRSGKSDLMATAAGLALPERGTLRVFGEEPAARHEKEIPHAVRPVGLVFDGGQLLHQLTLAENIALPLLYHLPPGEAVPAERIQALLALTGLERWSDKFPSQVSRNWQQRIGLARALAIPPRMLLLDSPLTGLDPRDAAWWLDLLDELSAGHPITNRQPLTLAVTADDLRPWIDYARQFAIVHERRFLPLGDRAAALAHEDPVLRDLLHRPRLKEPAR